MILAVPVPAKVTFVPSHTSDVGVVLAAAVGAALTVKLASAVLPAHSPLAATVYLIFTDSSYPILPVT